MLSLVNWSDLQRPAFFSETGQVITYGQLRSEVLNWIDSFPKQELIFLAGRNDISTITAYLACLEGGAVPLLLDADISPASLERLLVIYRPLYLFLPKELADLNVEFEVIKLMGDYAFCTYNFGMTPELNDDLALLLATSGSTGSPKLVRFALDNIVSNAKSIVEYLNISQNDRAVTTLPFNYSYGLSVLNSHLYAGASVLLTNKSFFDPIFWRLLKLYSVTSLAGVPYSYEILLKLRFESMNLPALKTLTQAGGKMHFQQTTRIAEICKSKAIRFFKMYGQTEASPRMAYLSPENLDERPESIGKAIPGGHFWLEDAQGKVIVENNEVGELIYRGSNVALGYAINQDDLKRGDDWQGLLRTGDLARKDAMGFFYIEGRISRFLKIFGVRVSLDAVESWFAERSIVVAAHGYDDNLHVAIEGTEYLVYASYVKSLAATMQIHPSAIYISTVIELPRLSSGKVDYSCLKMMR